MKTKEEIMLILERYDVDPKTHNVIADKIMALQQAENLNTPTAKGFKKILKVKDGGIWYLTDKEVKEWEQDGSIKSGDILYRVVEHMLY